MDQRKPAYASKDDMVRYQRRNDELQSRVVELEEKLETTEWTQKYEALRVPPGRLDVNKEVETIMSFPQEARVRYFDGTVRALKGPNTKPLETGDVVTRQMETGSDEESAEIRKYYDANKITYSKDPAGYLSAIRDFRKGVKHGEKK